MSSDVSNYGQGHRGRRGGFSGTPPGIGVQEIALLDFSPLEATAEGQLSTRANLHVKVMECILGQNGENVKELTETSGCGIGLEQKPGADDVVVVILKGTEGQIDRAQLLLQLRAKVYSEQCA